MLGYNEKNLDRAIAAKGRMYLFQDPVWEERFEQLIRLTKRTKIIQDLTGTDASPERIKAYILARCSEIGETDLVFPRGLLKEPTARNFLNSIHQKYDAALLISLHYGANGPGTSAQAETSLGAALDKRLQTFNIYQSIVAANSREPSISFETYIVLLNGIKSQQVEIHNCKHCRSIFAWPTSARTSAACPICAVHGHNIAQSRALIERRQQQHRAALSRSATHG